MRGKMVKAVVGANWGDEGKGKITDMLAKEADIVIRFQGGANAGHTIVNDYGKFALHTATSYVAGEYKSRIRSLFVPRIPPIARIRLIAIIFLIPGNVMYQHCCPLFAPSILADSYWL